MKWLFGILLSFLAILCFTGCKENKSTSEEAITWGELPELPNTAGLGGAFTGVSSGALIVAGGANFPDANEGETGSKVWHDEIYVFTDEEQVSWLTGFKLNQPLAYGASVSSGESLIMIGGSNAQGNKDNVTQLTWNSEKQTIKQESLPPLPQPLSLTDASIIGETLYVAGGQTADDTTDRAKVFLVT